MREVCNCQVCTTGRWILQVSTENVREMWENDGFVLEGEVVFNTNLWNKFKWWLHFKKLYIKLKYMRWV